MTDWALDLAQHVNAAQSILATPAAAEAVRVEWALAATAPSPSTAVTTWSGPRCTSPARSTVCGASASQTAGAARSSSWKDGSRGSTAAGPRAGS